jgi:hypothetical protein
MDLLLFTTVNILVGSYGFMVEIVEKKADMAIMTASIFLFN